MRIDPLSVHPRKKGENSRPYAWIVRIVKRMMSLFSLLTAENSNDSHNQFSSVQRTTTKKEQTISKTKRQIDTSLTHPACLPAAPFVVFNQAGSSADRAVWAQSCPGGCRGRPAPARSAVVPACGSDPGAQRALLCVSSQPHPSASAILTH